MDKSNIKKESKVQGKNQEQIKSYQYAKIQTENQQNNKPTQVKQTKTETKDNSAKKLVPLGDPFG